MAKNSLMQEPILKYPDPNKPYTLFTDPSKCILTQTVGDKINGKTALIEHVITYQMVYSEDVN